MKNLSLLCIGILLIFANCVEEEKTIDQFLLRTHESDGQKFIMLYPEEVREFDSLIKKMRYDLINIRQGAWPNKNQYETSEEFKQRTIDSLRAYNNNAEEKIKNLFGDFLLKNSNSYSLRYLVPYTYKTKKGSGVFTIKMSPSASKANYGYYLKLPCMVELPVSFTQFNADKKTLSFNYLPLENEGIPWIGRQDKYYTIHRRPSPHPDNAEFRFKPNLNRRNGSFEEFTNVGCLMEDAKRIERMAEENRMKIYFYYYYKFGYLLSTKTEVNRWQNRSYIESAQYDNIFEVEEYALDDFFEIKIDDLKYSKTNISLKNKKWVSSTEYFLNKLPE